MMRRIGITLLNFCGLASLRLSVRSRCHLMGRARRCPPILFTGIFSTELHVDRLWVKERVLEMGSAGDSPAPVGDPPTGTAEVYSVKRP